MTINFGWGGEAWGGDGWGGTTALLGGPLSIATADAISERQVQVVLSAIPLAQSPLQFGDALNPQTWIVTRLDTNETLPVAAVRLAANNVVELYLLKKLADGLISHKVSAPNLKDSIGGTIVPPNNFTFPGCVKEVPADVPHGMSDIANIPASGDTFAGTLQIDSSGDYRHDTGEALLQKLIIRRLTTMPNEYFYLPTYGLGLAVKGTLKISDVPKLQALAELQLLQEPEFKAVSVAITITSDNILYLKVKATLRQNNQQVSVDQPLQTTLAF